MSDFEKTIQDAVAKSLNSEEISKIITKQIEDGVTQSLKSLFNYSGAGKEMLDAKFKEIMVPAIESHDFNDYLVKLDEVLTNIVNHTNLVDNKTILENFENLMTEPKMNKIQVSKIFEEYCKYVSKNVSTTNLEAEWDDGEPYYLNVTCHMEVINKEPRTRFFSSQYEDRIIKLTCDEDENMTVELEVTKWNDSYDKEWKFNYSTPNDVSVTSLRYISDFEIFITKLRRAYVKFDFDTLEMDDYDVEVEEKPKWTLS